MQIGKMQLRMQPAGSALNSHLISNAALLEKPAEMTQNPNPNPKQGENQPIETFAEVSLLLLLLAAALGFPWVCVFSWLA